MMYAVILAGGWGRRFWPRSRRQIPKQMLQFGQRRSSLQDLFAAINTLIPKQRIWVVTNKFYADNLRRHLPALPGKNILVEPQPKNTAAACAWAALSIKRFDPQAVVAVLPSDNIILSGKKNFLAAIKTGCQKAQEADALVIIGIKPNRAAPEFGHIKIRQPALASTTGRPGKTEDRRQRTEIYKVEKFVEKPNLKKARAYWKSKKYFWNGGIFIFKVETMLKEIKRHLPQMYAGLERINQLWGKPQYSRQVNKEYKQFRNISIDYAVMEKAKNIYALVGDFTWVDIGSWANLPDKLLGKDRWGNITSGLCKNIDTCNSVILGEAGHLIATLGLQDLIVVHTPTATLVCRKDKAQQVRELTERLEKYRRFKKYL